MPGYGVGALASIVVSLAAALITYGGGLIPFDPLNLPAWLLGPLGAYTIAYSFVSEHDPAYYFIWGVILLGLASISAFYWAVNPAILIGVILLVAVAVGLASYRRDRR